MGGTRRTRGASGTDRGASGTDGAGRMDGRRWHTGFALFGEVVIVGVLLALLALPLVTALPALAAGIAHLRRHLAGEGVEVARLLRDTAAAWRALWPLALAFPVAALLLLWNLSLAEAGVVPGSAALRWGSLALLVAWVVLLLRTAAAWRPGEPAPPAFDALAEAVDAARRDPAGSLLLGAAAVMCAVFVWMLLPMLLFTGGLLALATVAVDLRRRARAGDGAATGDGPAE